MYERDILDEEAKRRRQPTYPQVSVEVGMIVEDRSSGFTGDVVKVTFEAVTLRDRHGTHRHFRYRPGGFLIEGRPVTLVKKAATPERAPTTTASGSLRSAHTAPARTARASRIWVEGRHDAELLEHVWGDDLRELGIVVEPLHGADDLTAAVAQFSPGPTRRLGVLLDHLVAGSKESRLAATCGRESVPGCWGSKPGPRCLAVSNGKPDCAGLWESTWKGSGPVYATRSRVMPISNRPWSGQWSN
jgi:hypothetical protein